MNTTPEKEIVTFTAEETTFIVKQWVEEKWKKSVVEAKPYHYIQEDKDKVGFKVIF